MKTIVTPALIGLCLALFFVAAGCRQQTADDRMTDMTRNAMEQAFREVGLPSIKNWTELRMMKMLYELRDDPKLINYAYTVCEYTGLHIYLGRCVGYGLPASVQYSNPERVAQIGSTHSWGWGTLPQPEPNGLFMPQGLSATYVMLINEQTGKPEPMYYESPVVVVPFKLPDRIVQTKEDINRWFSK